MPDLVITTTFTDTENCCGAAACDLTMPTLLIDGTTSPYADSSAAAAAIADQAFNCLLEALASSTNRVSLTASVASGTMTINESLSESPVVGSDSFITRVYLLAASDLGYTYNVSVDTTSLSYSIDLYEDDGSTLVDSASDSDPFGSSISGSGTLTVPSDGYYYVKITVAGTPAFPAATSLTFSGTLVGGASAVFCGIRAAYGGTPDYLVCT